MVSRPDEPVPPCNLPTVHAGDILLYLSPGGKRLRCDDELVNPKKDEPADRVCPDRTATSCPMDTSRTPTPARTGGARLPAQEAEPGAFAIDLHATTQVPDI